MATREEFIQKELPKLLQRIEDEAAEAADWSQALLHYHYNENGKLVEFREQEFLAGVFYALTAVRLRYNLPIEKTSAQYARVIVSGEK